MPNAAILDIDGTLVDTNYQHALTWFESFRQHGFVLPIWKIHRTVGQGGDQLVASLIGEDADEEHGHSIRASESTLFMERIDHVEPLEGARDLIVHLKDERGLTVVLASSAKQAELDHYLDLLDVRDLVDGWTSSADVKTTKPSPDLVEAAQDKAEARDSVLIGDTPWDIEAAAKTDTPTIAIMTGGFGGDELREAGAVAVFESIAELREGMGQTPLG